MYVSAHVKCGLPCKVPDFTFGALDALRKSALLIPWLPPLTKWKFLEGWNDWGWTDLLVSVPGGLDWWQLDSLPCELKNWLRADSNSVPWKCLTARWSEALSDPSLVGRRSLSAWWSEALSDPSLVGRRRGSWSRSRDGRLQTGLFRGSDHAAWAAWCAGCLNPAASSARSGWSWRAPVFGW